MPTVSKRSRDANGYWLIKDNPISKVGVYPYMGSELPAHLGLEPNKVYYVYRPAETLNDPETIDSFMGLPFIDDHEWLGQDGTPAEQKGVQGVTVGSVYFDAPYLKSDIKVFSDSAQKLIKSGKVELSPGYKCAYRVEAGTFEGKKYDLVQYNMRGNHLALVTEGRTGPDVAVQDHMFLTFDSMEYIAMEFTPEQLAQIQAMIADAVAKALADKTPETPAGDEVPDPEKKATDVEVSPVAAEAVVETTAEVKEIAEALVEAVAEVEQAAQAVEEATTTADSAAAIKRHTTAMANFRKVQAGGKKQTQDAAGIAALTAQVAELTKKLEANTVDAAGIAGQIAARDKLATRLSEHIGTFDHSAMSLVDVAKYGAEKVGITLVAGSEVPVMDAWLHGRKPEVPGEVNTHDSANVESLGSLWAKQKQGA